MLTIAELRSISAARLEDAQALFDAGRYDAASYLCGYSLELALKAWICETLNWAGYPATNREFRDLQSFRTHDLNILLRLSGQEIRLTQSMPNTWQAVKAWNPESRYRIPGTVSRSAAATLLEQMRSVIGAL